jgi:hypothetical protein
MSYSRAVSWRSRVWIVSPLAGERFVGGEEVHLEASLVLSPWWWFWRWLRGGQLQWSSDLDGPLGQGTELDAVLETVGTHTLTAQGFGLRAALLLRVFSDLDALYVAPLSPAELTRIESDFVFHWDDGTIPDQQWVTYQSDPFDPTSTRPSKLAALAKLEVLRHQSFTQPYPGIGTSLYQHVRANVHDLHFSLGTANQTGGGGSVWLNRYFSEWNNPYWLSLGEALIHETRHNEPGDPGHTTCTSWAGIPDTPSGNDMDATFQPGSGYAAAAMYLMWVAQYSSFDPISITSPSRTEAISLLRGRFCAKPTHTNPTVQGVLSTLIP